MGILEAIGRTNTLSQETQNLAGVAMKLRSQEMAQKELEFQTKQEEFSNQMQERQMKLQEEQMQQKIAAQRKAQEDADAPVSMSVIESFAQTKEHYAYISDLAEKIGIVNRDNPQNPYIRKEDLKQFVTLLHEPPVAKVMSEISLQADQRNYMTASEEFRNYMEKNPGVNTLTDKKYLMLKDAVDVTGKKLNLSTKNNVEFMKSVAQLSKDFTGESVSAYMASWPPNAELLKKRPKEGGGSVQEKGGLTENTVVRMIGDAVDFDEKATALRYSEYLDLRKGGLSREDAYNTVLQEITGEEGDDFSTQEGVDSFINKALGR